MIDACIECASHITRGTLTRVSLCKCLLTFIHVLEVLVELLLAGFPVLFPLDDVTSVLDVMTDEHLLQSAVRVLLTPPGLLYLDTPQTTNHDTDPQEVLMCASV